MNLRYFYYYKLAIIVIIPPLARYAISLINACFKDTCIESLPQSSISLAKIKTDMNNSCHFFSRNQLVTNVALTGLTVLQSINIVTRILFQKINRKNHKVYFYEED